MPDNIELGARGSDGWLPGRPAKVEVQTLDPKPTEDPMTDDRMGKRQLITAVCFWLRPIGGGWRYARGGL